MNLSTSSFKSRKISIVRALIITFFLLTGYHLLIVTKLVIPFKGINQWQDNLIRVQRYAYQNSSESDIVLAGSSLTANIEASDISPQAINLGIRGGCAQTGMEAVIRKVAKPQILLVEINESIDRQLDDSMINSIYNPFFYSVRQHLPMLRQEYQPVSVFLPTAAALKRKLMQSNQLNNQPNEHQQTVNVDSSLTTKLIAQQVEANQTPLFQEEASLLKENANLIKSQISQIKKDGVRVVLFEVPGEPSIQSTPRKKQIRALMKELFPISQYEWLPEPPVRRWLTSDGIHLVKTDAKDYAVFLKNQLLFH